MLFQSSSFLDNTKYSSRIILAELLYALKAQDQRRLMTQERIVEGIYLAK